MKWHVIVSKESMKQLKKMDKQTAALLTGWMRKNLEGCEDPRLRGKALSGNKVELDSVTIHPTPENFSDGKFSNVLLQLSTANRTGQWRYRVGDYRILAELQDERVIILVIRVGHRRDICDE